VRLQLIAGLVVGMLGTARAQETRVRFDTMLYHDTDHVDVVSPQVAAKVALDQEGGEISTTVIVDVVTAASVDVVSEATPGFTEVREEADLRVSKRFGEWLPGAHYRYSHESDYVSNGGGLSFERRLGTPDSVLTGGLDITYDIVGRRGTSFSDWSRTLLTTTGEIGLTQVLGSRTVLRAVYTLTLQNGYLAKPYRFVPLFDASSIAAANATGGLSLDSFDRWRLPERPPENVPDLRVRHALGVRGLHYLPQIDGSLRADYRLYFDDWGIWSHTLEAGLRLQLTDNVLGELVSRTYYQTSAWFWQRAYEVTGAGTIPTYRTVDKELSKSLAETIAVRADWKLGRVTLHGEASVTYDRFLDFMFLGSRTAFVVILGARWEPR
jgi:hypothetical protein